MTEQPKASTETVDTAPAEGATGKAPTVEELIAERDKAVEDAAKYKALMRTEEGKRRDVLKELDTVKASNMTDAEKAIAEAETRGREAAKAEIEAERSQLKLAAAAAKAGVPDEVLDLVDPTKLFVDGEINMELLTSLANKPKRFEKSASDLGIGAQSNVAGQLTRADMRGMTRAEINKARKEGKFDALMQGRL